MWLFLLMYSQIYISKMIGKKFFDRKKIEGTDI